VPVSLVRILRKLLNFRSFCATISSRYGVFLKESMTMRRMTKKAMALVLHAEGATVEAMVVYLDLAGNSTAPQNGYNAPLAHQCEGALP
jgi:hypothetical protein